MGIISLQNYQELLPPWIPLKMKYKCQVGDELEIPFNYQNNKNVKESMLPFNPASLRSWVPTWWASIYNPGGLEMRSLQPPASRHLRAAFLTSLQCLQGSEQVLKVLTTRVTLSGCGDFSQILSWKLLRTGSWPTWILASPLSPVGQRLLGRSLCP